MHSIPKHDFRPEAPAGSYKVVALSELQDALFVKRAARVLSPPVAIRVRPPWGSNRFVLSQRPTHPTVKRLRLWCENQIIADLESGVLIAHLFNKFSSIFHMIPQSFWLDRSFYKLSMNHLIIHPEQLGLPAEFYGSPIYVFDAGAKQWLLERSIFEDNPAYPSNLRTKPLAKTKGPEIDEIVQMICHLKSLGRRRDEIAKSIRKIDGFQNVKNELVRKLYKGRFPLGRPKQKAK